MRTLLLILSLLVVGCAAPPDGGDLLTIQEGQIFRVSLSGTVKKVLTLPEGAYAKDPSWSPDGKRLVFSLFSPPSPTTPPGSDIVIVNADGSGMETIRRHQALGEILDGPVFSPDGTVLYYTRFAQQFLNGVFSSETLEIIRHDLRASEAKSIIPNGTMTAASGDGKQLAYVRIDPDTYGQSLWVANSDGSNQRMLIDDTEFSQITFPRFSPSGTEIAFSGAPIPKVKRIDGLAGPLPVGVQHGLPSDLFTIKSSGGSVAEIVKLAEDNPTPLWSADGKKVVVVGAYAIYSVDMTTHAVSRLREPGGVGGSWRGR